MHTDTFNADFYVTAATIIPLLYLALTLQGQTYERLLGRFRKLSQEEGSSGWKLLRKVFLAGALALSGYAIIAGLLFGEIPSIIALYDRSAPSDNGQTVLLNLILLLVVVAAGPTFSFVTAVFAMNRDSLESQMEESPPAKTVEKTSQTSSAEESPE